jgi:hypothetical protein
MSPKQLFKAFQNAHFCPFHDVRLVPAICGRHAESMAFCLLSIGPPFSPRTAPWSCHFYFNILISHGFLDKNQVLLHNFAKRARSSWSQMVSQAQEKPLWVPGWDGEAQHLAVVVNCGKPGKPRQGWEPAGTIPERSKVLTYLDM